MRSSFPGIIILEKLGCTSASNLWTSRHRLLTALAGGTPDGTAGASDTGGATDSRPDNKVRFSRAHSQRNLCRPAGEVTCYGGR